MKLKNKKLVKNILQKYCDITISKAENGFIINNREPDRSVMGVNTSCVQIYPNKRPYVFESYKNMSLFIQSHFK